MSAILEDLVSLSDEPLDHILFRTRLRITLARHSSRFLIWMFHAVSGAAVDERWKARNVDQDWANVQRLSTWLARRRIGQQYPGSLLHTVYAPMPAFAPGTTPEQAMKALLEVDEAMRNGDYETVDRFDC